MPHFELEVKMPMAELKKQLQAWGLAVTGSSREELELRLAGVRRPNQTGTGARCPCRFAHLGFLRF